MSFQLRPAHSRSILLAALVASVGLAAPTAAHAQPNSLARADSLVRVGQLGEAEDLYYFAVRRQPRDPVARLALGRYLAARGALKVGAVLMEEARFFGGDARAVATQLVPVYTRLGDWRSLAVLPGSPLSIAERNRAIWLQANPAGAVGADSVSVPLLSESYGIGSVTLVIGTDTVRAAIDPTVSGIVLDTSWTTHESLKTFKAKTDTDRRAFAGVAPSVRLGGLLLVNAPVRFVSMERDRARLGLDVLATLAPTFDPSAGTLLLRRNGRAPQSGGVRLPIVMLPGDVMVVQDGAWSLSSDRGRWAVKGRWTWDARRGEAVIGA